MIQKFGKEMKKNKKKYGGMSRSREEEEYEDNDD